MSKKLVAVNDTIIIKPTERSNQTYANGIVMADMGKEKPEEGIIVSVGPGTYSVTGNFIPNIRKVGEEVVVPKFGCSQITIDGEDYILTTEKELKAMYVEETETEVNADGRV